MTSLPLPPIPRGLQELLKDYPDHLRRVQEVLDYVVNTSSAGVDPFERAIWVLESRLGTFIQEARAELQLAEAGGNSEAIALAREKKILFLRASSYQAYLGDPDFRAYFNEIERNRK